MKFYFIDQSTPTRDPFGTRSTHQAETISLHVNRNISSDSLKGLHYVSLSLSVHRAYTALDITDRKKSRGLCLETPAPHSLKLFVPVLDWFLAGWDAIKFSTNAIW